jgi:hypothetical protein
MKKNRFASLLLTGKVATLPLLISQARADVTPTYKDVIEPQAFNKPLRLVQLPFDEAAVKLQSVSTDSNYAEGSSYAAFLCNNLGGANAGFNFAVVGVQEGETIYLAAASNKNDAANLALDKRLTLGTQNLKILASTQIAPATGTGVKPLRSFTVNFFIGHDQNPSLQDVIQAGKAYVMAATVPAGQAGALPANWRFTELDEIRAGNCTTTSYGTSIY